MSAMGEVMHGTGGYLEHFLCARGDANAEQTVFLSRERLAHMWSLGECDGSAARYGPEANMQSASFSPDGCRVVTTFRREFYGEVKRRAWVWDIDTGLLLQVLAGHHRRVVSACFSPDGQRIVTASEDGSARVWVTETGALLLTLEGHGGGVLSAQFSPDGLHILTTCLNTDQKEAHLSTAPENQDMYFWMAFALKLESIPAFGPARLWDACRGMVVHSFGAHKDGVAEAFFSPDGARIITKYADNTLQIWTIPQ